jgi:hypothetical protein
MGLFFAFLASLFASFNNFAQRRSLDKGGTSKGYILMQMLVSFCVIVILNLLRSGQFSLGKEVVIFGILGGFFLGILTWSIGKTLENGPASLTFAFLSSASLVPSLFLFFCFGPEFGYTFNLWNAVGSLLVILGLFWATRHTQEKKEGDQTGKGRGLWGYFMTLTFSMHALFLGYLALWAIVLRENHPWLSTFSVPLDHRAWFMPIMLFTGTMMHLLLFLPEKRRLKKREVFYGMQGGVCHALCTFFLILAPQKSVSWENAMLFPLYAILVIIICNGWAQILYKERVNWKANALAFIGIALGTLGS